MQFHRCISDNVVTSLTQASKEFGGSPLCCTDYVLYLGISLFFGDKGLVGSSVSVNQVRS